MLIAGLFAWLAANLFFEEEYAQFLDTFSREDKVEVHGDLVIAEPVPMRGFEPTIFETFTRQRLNNVYETLVRPDRDLNMKPSLALSWGMLDDVRWEFNLRPDVLFHDGSELDAGDVRDSIFRARNYEGSELKDLLSTVEDVSLVDDLTLVVETHRPDPLLLQKLATVYVLPSWVIEKYGDEDVLEPIGTSTYKVVKLDTSGVLEMDGFARYWGDAPIYKNVTIVTILNTEGRVRAVQDGTVDVLDYVPHDFASELGDGYEVRSIPSLEVQFLIFNPNRSLFGNVGTRKAISKVFDREGFASYLGEFVRPSYQFVSNGVFGFDPDIVAGKVRDDVSGMGIEGRRIVVYLPVGLENLGEYIENSLEGVGMRSVVKYFDGEEYLEAIESGKADMYFMGYRSELGDASDFLVSVVHTSAEVDGKVYGQYNFVGEVNASLDLAVESQQYELDEEKRLFKLQNIMKTVVESDVIGVPLFEYETVFAVKDGLDFEPRIDGFIYINDIKPNED